MFIINAQKIKGNTSKGMSDYIEEKLNFLEGIVKVLIYSYSSSKPANLPFS